MKAALLIVCALLSGLAAATPTDWPRASAVPGGVALIELEGNADTAPTVTFEGDRVMVLPREGGWLAIVGIPLAREPGPAVLNIQQGVSTLTRGFTVAGKTYRTQTLKVAPKHVDLSAEDAARVAREQPHIRATVATFTASAPKTLRFASPVKGPRSSSFGLRRVFNNQPRNPHSGMDIAAPVGTAVVAPAPGRVIDTGDYFFNGQSVFIDHGQGLITMYLHMSRLDVAAGDRVEQGQVIGAVGASGRATGPHLCWRMRWRERQLDPSVALQGLAAARAELLAQ